MPKRLLLAGRLDNVLSVLTKAPRMAHIIAAGEGRQALDMIRSASPDAIIVGSSLGAMAEGDFLSGLRAMPARLAVPMMWVGVKPDVSSLPGGHRWAFDRRFTPGEEAAMLPVLAYIRENVPMAYYAPAQVWRGWTAGSWARSAIRSECEAGQVASA